MPSDFKKFQSSKCEERNLLNRTVICPTCIPDPTAPDINWISQSEPYFDARTCEYVSVYKIPRKKLLEEDFRTLSDIGERFKKESIRHLLRHYSKLENDYTVCAFGGCLTSEDFEIYRNAFNNFYNMLSENYQQIVEKYSLTSLTANTAAGGILGALALFAGGAVSVAAAASIGPVLALMSFILSKMSEAEQEEFFKDQAAEFGIDDLRDDLINLIGPDKLEGLARLVDVYSEIHPYALEWVANIPDDGYIVDDSNHLKFKLTVPAHNFDLIPPASSAEDGEDAETENTTSFPDEIIITTKELQEQKNNLLAALKVFNVSYEFFKRIESGRLLYKEGTTYSTFNLAAKDRQTKEFFEKLGEFLSKNNYRFPYQFVFNLKTKIAEEIKIVFDNSDPKKPLKIKSIFAKSPYCDFEELTIGSFTSYNSTVMNFLINIKEINNKLTCLDKIEWLDFCLDYVYPELKVDYGRNTGAELDEESIIDCLGDPGDWAGENILNPLFNFFSTYAFDLEQKVCSGDATPDEANPLSVLDSINREKIAKDLAEKRRKAIEREEKAKRDEQVKKLQEQGRLEEVNDASSAKQVDDSPYAVPESDPTITIEGEEYYYLEPNNDNNTEAADAHELLSDVDLGAKVDERVKEEAAKISENMGQKWHQFYIQQALDSVSIDETFMNFINSFVKTVDTSSGDWWYDMLNYLGLCGLTSVSTAAIQCISKGISLDDLQETLIKNTLKSLPMENWSDLLIGLPPSARSQIEQQMVEDFGESFQPPWASEENTQVIKSPEERRQKIANAASALKNRYQKALTALEEEIDKFIEKDNVHKATMVNYEKKAFIRDAEQYVDKPNEKFTQRDLKRFSILIDKNIKNDVDKTGTIDLSKSAKLIVDAYVDAIIKYVDNNLVMQQLRQLPGADAIVGILNVLIPDCEGRQQKELGQILEGLEPSGGFLETFKVDICNPNLAINKINPPDFSAAPNLLKFVGVALKETIDRMIGEFVKLLIMDTLRVLDSSLCKALESIGKLANDFLLGENNPLEEVFKEAFCPDLNDDQVRDELNKLLGSAGPFPTDRSSPDSGNLDLAACLGNALAGTVTKMQLLQVMLNPTQNPSVLQNMADAIALNCPELADIYGASDLLEEFLENLTSALPPEAILALQEAIDPEQDEILSESICFTSQELEAYLRSLESVYRELGIPAEEAAQLGYQNTLNSLNSALDQSNSLDDTMQDALDSSPSDAIQDLLDSLPPGDYSEEELRQKLEQCTDLNNTSDFGGNLFNQPSELVQIENQMTDTLFSQIHDFFLRDLISDDNGILSRILSDRQGIAFSRHSFLNDNFLLGTFYHNTPESAAESTALLDFLNPFTMIPDRGFFPQTIGIYMRNQLLNDITIQDSIDGSPNMTLQYEASDAATLDYGDSNAIKYYDEIGENLNYSVEYNSRVMNYRKGNLEVEKTLNNSELLKLQPFLSNDTSLPYRKRTFNAFILEKLGNFAPYYILDSDLYSASRTKLFNFVKKIIVGNAAEEVSNGFLFGWQDDPITKQDLTYVAPDGSPYSFSEEEAVLGRSATNNPRVHFLDPSIYGGTYLKPPVYVENIQFNGWMDVVTRAIPEISDCSNKDDNLFRINEISSYSKKVKNSSRMDKRLGQNTSKSCFEEKPFDKIASNASKAGLAGIVKSMIRTHVIDNTMKSLPILMNLKYNKKNYDDLFSNMLAGSMRDSIEPVGTLFSKIQRENFYLLFLEQVVVDYQRKIDEGTFLPTSHVEDALEIISAAESNYTSIASTFANLPNGKLTAPSITEEYIENFDFENYDRKKFIFYALRYQALKEKLFSNTEELSTNPNLLRAFIPLEDLLLDCKIFMIRVVRDQCEVILAELIGEEFKKTVDFLFKNLSPKINDLKLFSLTNEQLFSNTELENIGTTSYDNKVANFETVILGDVKDVVDNIEEASPFSKTGDQEFIIEKYIRVKDKDGVQIQEIIRRDYSLRNVVSTEGFTSLIESIKEEHPDKYLSEIFGDAELTYGVTARQLLDSEISLTALNSNNVDLTFEQTLYFSLRGAIPNRDEIAKTLVTVNKTIIEEAGLEIEPTGYRGEIGIKTGIRICLKTSSGAVDPNYAPAEEDLNVARREKTFYCNHRNAPDLDTYGFPICSVETEMLDHKVSEFNLDSGPYRFDLDCLLRKLTESEDFELMFDKILNFNSLPSILSIYSNMFFIDSIGREDDWDSPDGLTPWVGAFADWPTRPDGFFERTYKICRKMFASFYYSSELVNKEMYKDSAQSEQLLANAAKDYFRNILQIKAKTDKLKSPNPFAKSHRLYTSKPFDKEGEECDNPYKQIFS
jgi:hypothetical protein